MEITSERLIKDLHKVLTSSIANQRFYKARATGFRSELEFERLAKERKLKFLDGGQFLFTRKYASESPENHMVFITVSNGDQKDYQQLYNLISNMTNVKKLFFIKVENLNQWSETSINIKNSTGERTGSIILTPKLEIFEFKNEDFVESDFSTLSEMFPKKSNKPVCSWKSFEPFRYLIEYDSEELAKIYANRFVLDIFLGDVNKGMIDVDLILVDGDEFTMVETKEKDPIKRDPQNKNTWFFGWDSRRFSWYEFLKLELGINSWYVIREVNNQTERKFVCWKKIDIEKFSKSTSWLQERAGGGGGGTIEAPYRAFDDL